jgi:hypothetical protein
MKKVILFVAVIIAASFASCKKDYACKCTAGSVSVTGDKFNNTKKKAKDECTAKSTGGWSCEAVKQ